MAEDFGARLRKRREQQQIDLSVIAEQTKIKRSLLDALERDDLSQWPSGIFRRAWVRSYAKAVGLDADATVREFLELHPDPEELPVEPAGPPPAEAGFRGILGAALGSLSKRMLGSTEEQPPSEPQILPAPKPEPVSPIAASVVAPVVLSPAAPVVRKQEPARHEVPKHHVAKPTIAEFDLPALARICTKFGQAGGTKEVQPLLQDVASILDAAGLIVWFWHPTAAVLRPMLVHGYSAGVVARLPAVTREDDNPTAASFRTSQVREVAATDNACGALVMPLLVRSRCVGVLAIELQPGRELTDSARAVAAIVAAAVAQMVSRTQPNESRSATSKRRATFTPLRGTV